jgi:hypothetical protein
VVNFSFLRVYPDKILLKLKKLAILYVMATIDLYTILESYAKKNHSPYIDVDKFILYLEKSAKYLASAHSEWIFWLDKTKEKVWQILPNLVNEEKCKITTNAKGSQIFLSAFYINVIRRAYASQEAMEIPFPDEKILRLNITPDQVKTVYIENDLVTYLDKPQETVLPLIRLTFPRDIPSIIILSELIPKRLLEMAILKIQKYLWGQGNKEHIRNRMISRFQGKEEYLKDMINYIMTQPMSCLPGIESGGDISFLFWAFFCNMIKSEVIQKNELTAPDIAILQSVYVLEIFNNYHKSNVVKAKEREAALKNLGLCFEKPPYLYNLSAITKFSDSKGIPLLGRYSQEDLKTFLTTKTTEHKENELPDLLIIHNLAGEQLFIKKTVVLPFCLQLLSDTRTPIKKAISDRWFKMLKTYEREPAMNEDEAFEKLLARMIKDLNPILVSLLKDNKLLLTYYEMKDDIKPSESSKLFENGKLLSFSLLLTLDRKALLADTLMLLPFWYSITILVNIITFFMHLGKSKTDQKKMAEGSISESSRNNNLPPSLKELARDLIPPGMTLQNALVEQEARWNTRINPQARKDLTADVNTLIMNRMRKSMQLPKKPRITRDFLEQIASAFISESVVLQQLNDHEALALYIKLYIINLLLNKKI